MGTSQGSKHWDKTIEQASISDVGLRRANNQDSKAVVLASGPEKWQQRGHLFMVADGMGAHAAGELASKLATDIVPQTYDKLTKQYPPPEALKDAVLDANSQINARGQSSEDFRGMGTTVSTLVLFPEGAVIAHVGDSRTYRLRNRHFEQLTFDHSLVWEIRAAGPLPGGHVPDHIPKNVITRSLGPNPTVQVDMEGPFPVKAGDTFLLCSDGLSGQVTDEEIGKVLVCLPPDEAVQALVDLANLRGGPDNITVIVARVVQERTADAPSAEPALDNAGGSVNPTLTAAIGVLLLAALGLGGLAFAQSSLVIGLAAAAAGVGALISGVFALNQWNAEPAVAHQFDGRPLGKGPYTAFDCTADAEFVDELGQIIGRLHDHASHSGWKINLDSFNDLNAQAARAAEENDYETAVRRSCHAISYLMRELRARRK